MPPRSATSYGPIGDAEDKPYGNGVFLWFETDDFDAAMARAEAMRAEIVMPRHRNPPSGSDGPNHWECGLRDPDCYAVVLASPMGQPMRPHERAAKAIRRARL